MMYLLRLWAGVSQCKITQYLYVQKTNLPGVFSWFQPGVFNPDPQRPVKNWFWQRTILQAVFFSKTEWRTCWATWLSTWSPLSLQIFHQSIRPLTIQTFPTKCWRTFLFITPAFGVFFFCTGPTAEKTPRLAVRQDGPPCGAVCVEPWFLWSQNPLLPSGGLSSCLLHLQLLLHRSESVVSTILVGKSTW